MKISYVSEQEMDSTVLEEFTRILELKGANQSTQTTVTRVNELPADRSTGKHRLVILPRANESEP